MQPPDKERERGREGTQLQESTWQMKRSEQKQDTAPRTSQALPQAQSAPTSEGGVKLQASSRIEPANEKNYRSRRALQDGCAAALMPRGEWKTQLGPAASPPHYAGSSRAQPSRLPKVVPGEEGGVRSRPRERERYTHKYISIYIYVCINVYT